MYFPALQAKPAQVGEIVEDWPPYLQAMVTKRFVKEEGENPQRIVKN